MHCEECGERASSVLCTECDQALCAECDATIHRGGKRKDHLRPKVCVSCRKQAVAQCVDCSFNVCADHGISHVNHETRNLTGPQKIGIFWDLNSCRPVRPEDVGESVSLMREKFQGIEFIRGYGESFHKWVQVFKDAGVELGHCEGLRESEVMLLEMSFAATRGLTMIVLFTTKAASLRHHLIQLQAKAGSVKIAIAADLGLMRTITVNEIPDPQANRTSAIVTAKPPIINRNSFSDLRSGLKPGQQTVIIDACPLYQQFYRRSGQETFHDQLIELFKEQSEKGNLMYDFSNVIRALQLRVRITNDQASTVLKNAERLGLIHITKRQFGNMRSFIFVSLKLEGVSLECLLWVLRSLKNDEMMPTERAIQSRMKEVFDLKPSTTQWNNLLEAARNRLREKHQHSRSAPLEKPEIQFSLFGHSPADSQPCPPAVQIPNFVVNDMFDPVTGTETCVIYPEGEEWVALDQHTKVGDVLKIKDTEEWQEFVRFLESYFAEDKKAKKKLGKKIEDDSKAIPGGRYGCAQFLKMCGPPVLKKCSLGKLSYMVQLAINDDLLRYQRTLLIWTPVNQKRSFEDDSAKKLKAVQRSIIELLSESRNGISLAQLPLHLKRSLTFSVDLTELGFAKLKDLLQTIPEVTIELRGTNHPFAVLAEGAKTLDSRSQENTFTNDVDDLVKAMSNVLHDNRFGVTGPRLEALLSEKFGHMIDWRIFDSANIYDFARKWGAGYFDIIDMGQTKLITRVEEPPNNSYFSSSYFFSPYRDQYSQSATFDQSRSVSPNYFHSHSNSQASENYKQHSYSAFYMHQPVQKVVNVSNLPAELSMRQPMECINEFEGEDDNQRKYIETLLCEDEDLSTTLHGSNPLHYRTDSVEYHSSHPSFGVRDWGHLGSVEIPTASHSKAQSEDWNERMTAEHRQNRSCFDTFGIGPPPGF
jgi:hypothetical protein